MNVKQIGNAPKGRFLPKENEPGIKYRKFWSTISLVALTLPIPLSVGMAAMTGVFSHSVTEVIKSLISYYALWLIVDTIGIGCTIFKYRKEI